MIIPLQRASSWKHVFIEMTSCHLATYRFELNIPLNYIYHESPTRFVKNPWRLRSGAIFLLLMVPLTSPELQMVPSNIQAMPGEPFFVKPTQDMEGHCQKHTIHLIWGPFLPSLFFFSQRKTKTPNKKSPPRKQHDFGWQPNIFEAKWWHFFWCRRQFIFGCRSGTWVTWRTSDVVDMFYKNRKCTGF